MAVTFATLMDEYSQFVEVLDRYYKNGSGAGGVSNSMIASLSALDAVLEDDPSKPNQVAAMSEARDLAARPLTGWPLNWWASWCSKFARFVDAPATGLAAVPYIWKYFHDNSQTVARRNFTRGSWSWTTSANSLSANLIQSISTDEEGYSIEDGPRYDSNDSDIVHEIEVTSDPQTGSALGQLVWTLSGDPATDALDDPSSFTTGLVIDPVDGGSSGSNANLLGNGLFEKAFTGTGQTKVPDWYIDAQEASVTADTASGNGFRPKRNSVTADNSTGDFSQILLAYNATAQPKLTQYLSGLSSIQPYLYYVIFKGTDGTADGNVTLTVGSQSVTAAVGTSWTILALHGTTPSDAWYSNLAADPLPFEIQRTTGSGISAGSVAVHAAGAYPFANYLAGRYLMVIAGPDEFRLGDLATATDSVGNTSPAGTNNYWWNRLSRASGVVAPRFSYLPSAASATANAHDYS